jgi:hypothetical protein
MENKANGEVRSTTWDSPKPKNLKVKTGIKAGPKPIPQNGGD